MSYHASQDSSPNTPLTNRDPLTDKVYPDTSESQAAVPFITTEKPLQVHNEPQTRRRTFKRTFELLKSLILPIVAIIYLGFCYTVSFHTVPVTANGVMNTSPRHLATVKSGITSISIIIIGIGLFPLKSLISDLKSEEFFRALRTHSQGVPLSNLNGISNPSFGTMASAKAIKSKRSTPFFIAAFIAGFLAAITSTLAPAALTIDPVLWDSDMMAFKVGSILRDSILNVSSIVPGEASNLVWNTKDAASIAWAESLLGVRYYFTQQGNISAGIPHYITPFPADLPVTTPARWLTDVGALHPRCAWASHNITNTIFSANDSLSQSIPIHLIEPGVVVNFQPDTFLDVGMKYVDPVLSMKNQTNGARPSNGVAVWSIFECFSGCRYNDPRFGANIHVDFSNIPTFQYGNVNKTFHAAYLTCTPQMALETREVRNDGTGQLTVHGDRTYTKQGNLHFAQTNMLFSLSVTDLDTAGPSVLSFGSKLLASMIFGKDQVNAVNQTAGDYRLKPSPLDDITNAYARILQSTMKVFVGGSFGTVYVPGRISREAVIFRSSLPYVIASTVLFVILAFIVLAAHLRSGKGEKFTLFSVAAALDGSGLPAQFAQMKEEAEHLAGMPLSRDKMTDGDIVESLGTTLVSLTNVGGKDVLHLQ